MTEPETTASDRDRNATEWTGSEIAIIGMACRFPGASSPEAFWQNLVQGVESLTLLEDESLERAGVDPVLLASPHYVKVKRTVDDIDQFDAAFFNCTPRDAEVMDPQHRFMLEVAWEALEHAGYDPARTEGLIGIYAGSKASAYQQMVWRNPQILETTSWMQIQAGSDKDFLATRVAYKLGLGGPAVNVQTACSTSLVACHLAVQNLLSGDCDLALAGGVAITPTELGYLHRPGDIFSPDGRVRAFDAAADGTTFGSGIGLVVLKRLEDALAENDTVYAVIRGSAVNNDGSLKVGYTAPGADGQARVVRAALTVAEVEPSDLSYVETHGTGTPTGDPIEVSALTRVFTEETREKRFCALGSVKTNIGHLAAAAGAAGLIKTVLALYHQQLPASLLFERPNPQLDLDQGPFFVNHALCDWPDDRLPRRAGVSAFGFGGTNAHVVLEEAPPEASAPAPCPGPQVLVLSARSESALDTLTERLAAHLKQHPRLALADVAWTLQKGRHGFACRRSLVAVDMADAGRALEARDPARLRQRMNTRGRPPVALLFTGQGAQYPGMAQGLYQQLAVFRDTVDRCCELLTPHLGLDLSTLLLAAPSEQAAQQLAETRFTQPALFVVEYALARLWRHWGIVPEAMIGHSIGEYVAATLAGVFSLEDALALVAARGRLMQALPAGSMLAVPLGEAALTPYLDARLAIAAINGVERCVVAGPSEAIEALSGRLAAAGISSRPLKTSHAFHSPMMEPVLGPFLERVRQAAPKPPSQPFVSNVTGTWIQPSEATDPEYWALHLRQTVRFEQGLETLLGDGPRVLLEVGPGNTLATLAKRHPQRTREHDVLSSLRHPEESVEDLRFLLDTVGRLWLAGVEPDWRMLHGEQARRRVALPTYPFEHQRYWIEEDPDAARPGMGGVRRLTLDDWFYLPTWQPSLTPLAPTETEPGVWLVFADDTGLAEAVLEILRTAGHRVKAVRPGESFEHQTHDRYRLVPEARDDYVRLLESMAAGPGAPSRILHLWSVTGAREPGDEESLTRGFASLLALAQALGARAPDRPVHLVAVADRSQRLEHAERPLPAKATLLGPCLVGAREYPFLRATVIDVPPVAGDALTGAETSRPSHLDRRALARRLIAEAHAPERGAQLAYRYGERFVRGLEPTRVDRVDPARPAFTDGGVYLITGGLGGLGLTFAEYLARQHHARLVLLGRSVLPPKEDWDACLGAGSESGEDRLAAKLRALRALEALGAEVMTASVDIADVDALRVVIAAARDRFSTVDGVIHAAGVASGGVMQLRSLDDARAVLRPKVAGTRALEAAFGDHMPGCFVLCSSTIALLGTVGQADYCAANAFLDAWAEAQAAAGHRGTVSINWSAWRDVGMAVAQRPSDGPDFSRGGMRPADGTEVLARIVSRLERPQVVVSPRDLVASLAQLRAAARRADTPAKASAEASAEGMPRRGSAVQRHPRPALSSPFVAPCEGVEQHLAEIWQQVLGIEGIGTNDNFFELGGDSVVGIQVIAKAGAAGVALTPEQLFAHPTIAELAALAAEAPDESEPRAAAETTDDAASDSTINKARLSEDELAAVLRQVGEMP